MFWDWMVFGNEWKAEGEAEPIRVLRDLFGTTERITWREWFEESCCDEGVEPTEEHEERTPTPVVAPPELDPVPIPVDVLSLDVFLKMLDCEITHLEKFHEHLSPYEWVTGSRWQFYFGGEEFWAASVFHGYHGVSDYKYTVIIRKATTMAQSLAEDSKRRQANLDGAAKRAAAFFGEFESERRRGVHNCGDMIIVFGHDYASTDAKTQVEVQLFRDHLATLGLQRNGFGATADGHSWAIVALNFERLRIDISELEKTLARIYDEVWHAKATGSEEGGE